MEERARALARVPLEAVSATEGPEAMVFVLGAERYAVETRLVLEILRLVDLTPVPGLPDYVMGVINLRGEVLAVVDLRCFLGLPAAGLTDLSRVLVLGSERAEFGVLADEVSGMARVRAEELRPPPTTVGGPGRACLRGIAADALIVLDGDALLRDPRLHIDQDAGDTG